MVIRGFILLSAWFFLNFRCLDTVFLHHKQTGCDRCSDYICGDAPCSHCANMDRYERPKGMCYNYLPSESKCASDVDCQIWQVCLYKYKNEADFQKFRNHHGFCVNTMPQIASTEVENEIDSEVTASTKKINNGRHKDSPAEIEIKGKIDQVKDGNSKCASVNRKLIIDVDKSGFGNRIVSLLSAIYLAIKTNRVLYLKWSPDNHKCGATFQELFRSEYITSSRYNAFSIWNETDRVTNSQKISQTQCTLFFDQGLSLKDYHFLNNVWLFNKMNEDCDIIYIQGNRYFGAFIYSLDHEHHQDYLKNLLGPNPLAQLSTCIFRIHEHTKKQVADKIVQIRQHGPYMSLHMRSVYTNKLDIPVAFDCVNHLLKNGIVKRVFVATDFDEFETMARKLIHPKEALVTISKKLETRRDSDRHNPEVFDSYDIRANMQDAIKEYNIINRADFCGSTSMEFSTFSQSSLLGGNCKYIDVLLGEKCFPTHANESFSSPEKIINSNPPFHLIEPHLSKDKMKVFYDSLDKKQVSHYFPCRSTSVNSEDVKLFWSEAARGKCYENA